VYVNLIPHTLSNCGPPQLSTNFQTIEIIYASGYTDDLVHSWRGNKPSNPFIKYSYKLKHMVSPQKALSSIPKLLKEGNALSISPFLVLDDNPDICVKDMTIDTQV
jgi:hypothetical protein